MSNPFDSVMGVSRGTNARLLDVDALMEELSLPVRARDAVWMSLVQRIQEKKLSSREVDSIVVLVRQKHDEFYQNDCSKTFASLIDNRNIEAIRFIAALVGGQSHWPKPTHILYQTLLSAVQDRELYDTGILSPATTSIRVEDETNSLILDCLLEYMQSDSDTARKDILSLIGKNVRYSLNDNPGLDKMLHAWKRKPDAFTFSLEHGTFWKLLNARVKHTTSLEPAVYEVVSAYASRLDENVSLQWLKHLWQLLATVQEVHGQLGDYAPLLTPLTDLWSLHMSEDHTRYAEPFDFLAHAATNSDDKTQSLMQIPITAVCNSLIDDLDDWPFSQREWVSKQLSTPNAFTKPIYQALAANAGKAACLKAKLFAQACTLNFTEQDQEQVADITEQLYLRSDASMSTDKSESAIAKYSSQSISDILAQSNYQHRAALVSKLFPDGATSLLQNTGGNLTELALALEQDDLAHVFDYVLYTPGVTTSVNELGQGNQSGAVEELRKAFERRMHYRNSQNKR